MTLSLISDPFCAESTMLDNGSHGKERVVEIIKNPRIPTINCKFIAKGIFVNAVDVVDRTVTIDRRGASTILAGHCVSATGAK